MSGSRDIVLRRPDDMHVHLRQSPQLAGYAEDVARHFARAIIMPNLKPPITTPAELRSYRDEILAAVGRAADGGPRGASTRRGLEGGRPDGGHPPDDGGPDGADRPDGGDLRRSSGGFLPLMTFMVRSGMSRAEVRALREAGAIAGKYYPRGVTTNSEEGVSDLPGLLPTVEAMEAEGLVLCIHGEEPGAEILDRERAFLPRLRELSRGFPRLRIVLEHVSTAAGVEAVLELSDRVAATVTVHHLLYCLDDLLGDGLVPHLYCKPVVKGRTDREAIRRVVLDGNARFFFGSDSAPHPRSAKEGTRGAAGVYSMPVSLSLLAAFFEERGRLERLEPFLSRFGAEFYGLPLNEGRILLRREGWRVPEELHGVVPLEAGSLLAWRVIGPA